MAERFQGVSERTVELGLALNPYDERTGSPLRGAATVSVEGVHDVPRLNPSGYWLFLTPPTTLDASVTVSVEPPPEYAERTLTVDTTQSPPAERIPVYPSTAASFPPGTTLVRGRVTHGGTEAVADATVGIEHTDLLTRTDTDGTFVLELRGIATNPVLIALAAGLTASQVGLSVPGTVDTGLGAVSELALPVAVLCVGSSLVLSSEGLDYGLTGSVVAMKVGVMPLVAWGVFTLLAVDPVAIAPAVLMFGMPTAVSTYVYANELGGDAQLASLNVFVTTVASLASVAVIVQVLG